MSTVKVQFTTDEETYTMVFGDSYKTWQMQLQEYIYYLKRKDRKFTINKLDKSSEKFRQNGLKWCDIKEYQGELTEDALEMHTRVRNIEDFKWRPITLPKGIEL